MSFNSSLESVQCLYVENVFLCVRPLTHDKVKVKEKLDEVTVFGFMEN